MLDLKVEIDGNKVVVEGLQRFAKRIPGAIQSGIDRVGRGIFVEAHKLLSGAGAKGTSTESTSRNGKTYLKWNPQNVSPGGFPVPVRTGNLRNHLDLLLHGQTKSDDRASFSAGPFESIIFNSAPYSRVIHEGLGSSSKYGPRRYTTDALSAFNEGDRIRKILEEEIMKAKNA